MGSSSPDFQVGLDDTRNRRDAARGLHDGEPMNASARLTTHLPRELVRWLDGHGDDPTRAWRECPHAHWLLHLALAVHLDRALCVRAAADLAGAALSGRDVDASAASALRTALAWLDGGANASQAWAC